MEQGKKRKAESHEGGPRDKRSKVKNSGLRADLRYAFPANLQEMILTGKRSRKSNGVSPETITAVDIKFK